MLEAIPLQNYHLSSNSLFVFEVKEINSRNKYDEICVREATRPGKAKLVCHLVLTALDGEDQPGATQ